MHPNRKFHIGNPEEMASIVRSEAFGILVAQTGEGLRCVHAPLLLDGDRLRFHVSRGNAVHDALLAGAQALAIVNGPHAYVSPDWYGLDDRVPTWSYVAVEMEGPVRPLSEAELVRLLDDMSAEHEERLVPKPVWTRDKLSAGRFEGLLKAIRGFELSIASWRGTAKIDQDKSAQVRTRVGTALAVRGDTAMARLYFPPPDFRGRGTARRAVEGSSEARRMVPASPSPPLHHAAHGPPPLQKQGRTKK